MIEWKIKRRTLCERAPTNTGCSFKNYNTFSRCYECFCSCKSSGSSTNNNNVWIYRYGMRPGR